MAASLSAEIRRGDGVYRLGQGAVNCSGVTGVCANGGGGGGGSSVTAIGAKYPKRGSGPPEVGMIQEGWLCVPRKQREERGDIGPPRSARSERVSPPPTFLHNEVDCSASASGLISQLARGSSTESHVTHCVKRSGVALTHANRAPDAPVHT